MPSNTPPIPPITAPSIPDLCQQPFPGAVSAMATTSQPRPTAIEVPPALPRPGFMFRADGVLSDDAPLVFSEWSGRVGQLINNIDTLQQSHELLRERCLLLSAACKKHDITYIVMHHIYCIWSHSKQHAYQIMLPFAPDAIDSAFAALSLLVKTNDALSPAQLDWFHRFPAQTFDSFVPSPILVRVIKDILRLLSAFAAHWPDFRARIISRSFPALVCEMRDVLQCSSYIVQNIIFHTSRRLLGCPDGYLMDVFQNSFDRDRNFESAISFNRFTPDHIQQTRQALVMNYSGLIAHIRSQAHSISHVLQSLDAPGAHTARELAVAHTPRSSAVQPNDQTQLNQMPVVSASVRFLGSGNSTFVCSSPNQPFQSSGQTIHPFNGTHSPIPVPPRAQPRNIPNIMPQHVQPTVPLKTNSASSLAAFLEAAPGKVFRRIPESEYPQSAYGLPSLMVGLHLARQRSPRRVPLDNGPMRYYQYVDNLVLQPIRLEVSMKLNKIEFSLSKHQLQRIPVRQESDIRSLPVVRFEDNTLRFRVRVCRFPSGYNEMSESKWLQAGTFWPEQMHVMINSIPCLLSRKQHFHTDLPVEITTNVKSGDNELHVSLPSLSQNEVGYDYFIGVEIVTTQKYASVWRAINTKPRSSADATRDAIKHRYRLHDTDEVALLSSTWKVSICDPISSKMCDTPVRGIDCKHFECFDLENWLQTRPLKPGASQTEPCLVDCWACPICGGDARPNQLRICDYFSDVVKQLREAGNSEMRTIVISENAEWQPLVEISYYQKQESPSGGHLHQSQQAAKKVEVIEILDD
ncbi:Zinc finger MIZ domain-containing protein 1 [Beauveria bassiana]|nr:Zinc finger MIZ domain-containing protein 1 [Beauveria bassiana]